MVKIGTGTCISENFTPNRIQNCATACDKKGLQHKSSYYIYFYLFFDSKPIKIKNTSNLIFFNEGLDLGRKQRGGCGKDQY
jgi:hypothetical protein